MSSTAIMIIAIVFIVTVARLIGNQQKLRIKAAALAARDAPETRRLKSEVARLNERIQVLERLATDPARRLSDEIDSLKALPGKPSLTKSSRPTEETDNAQR